jgi:putative ubiquitin-RnfH superfamily antitoxin RatB of RatAB toxin-antitoxin module
MDEQRIDVEVVYALPDEQVVCALMLPVGASVAMAIARSGLCERYPELAARLAGKGNVGIHGKPVALGAPLKAHDRVEIYRPLAVDPKEARRRRVRLRGAR